MREFKFRIWSPKLKQMGIWINHMITLDGELQSFNDDAILIGTKQTREELGSYIVMQYTGMKDIDGREIYEGDIYIDRDMRKVGEWDETVHQVIFDKGAFKIKGEIEISYKGESYRENRLYSLDTIQQRKMEHVGNIYENPELLEEE